jgi:hypothetical protein
MTLVYILRLRYSSSWFLQLYEGFADQFNKENQNPEFGQIFCLGINTKSIESFIEESKEKLDEYMPVLLRAAGNTFYTP